MTVTSISVTKVVNYVGETIPLWHTAIIETPDGDVALEPSMIDHVAVRIFKRGVEVVAETTTSWSEENQRWDYDWDTDGLASGRYLIQWLVYDHRPKPVWEFMDFRLQRNRV